MEQTIQKTKLKARDIATIGIFGGLIFVVTALTGAATGLIPLLYAYSTVFCAIIIAPFFMLIVAKVNKTGAIFVTAILLGLIWSLLGGFPILIGMVIAGGIGELIVSKTKYKNMPAIYLAFGIFNVGYFFGVMSPYYFTIFAGIAADYPAELLAALHAAVLSPVGYVAIPSTFFVACGAAFVSKKMLRKHFKDTGLVNE